MIDWTKPRQITAETVLEEARAMERAGKGKVIDDGHPPALWVPYREPALTRLQQEGQAMENCTKSKNSS